MVQCVQACGVDLLYYYSHYLQTILLKLVDTRTTRPFPFLFYKGKLIDILRLLRHIFFLADLTNQRLCICKNNFWISYLIFFAFEENTETKNCIIRFVV